MLIPRTWNADADTRELHGVLTEELLRLNPDTFVHVTCCTDEDGTLRLTFNGRTFELELAEVQ